VRSSTSAFDAFDVLCLPVIFFDRFLDGEPNRSFVFARAANSGRKTSGGGEESESLEISITRTVRSADGVKDFLRDERGVDG
jgi:hypothetical protein